MESITAPADRLLPFRNVARMLGLADNTSHTIRAMAKRGQLKEVRLNGRLIRYSERSVLDLIQGKASA
jgi:predicted DNA-binding transcriptional regulator AlpA